MSDLPIFPKTNRVKADTPRPLTNAERNKLRKKCGGFAKPEALQALEAKFSKPRNTGVRERSQSVNNGWSK